MRSTSLLIVLVAATLARADDVPPRPIAAWAAGPLEARVVFDRPVPESLAKSLVGMRIVFGDDAKDGERGSLRIAAAHARGDVLVLATDPHSRDTTYVLHSAWPRQRRRHL